MSGAYADHFEKPSDTFRTHGLNSQYEDLTVTVNHKPETVSVACDLPPDEPAVEKNVDLNSTERVADTARTIACADCAFKLCTQPRE